MNRLIPLTLLLFVLAAPPTLEVSASSLNASPQTLESYVGKYPSELFKGMPAIRRRLRTLLGANYSFFMQRLQTEMPIESDDGALVARGCMAHSCGIEEAVLVINLGDGKIHCAILSSKYGGKFKVFSEDKAHLPPALHRAMKQP